ncbi:hypothetical protein KW796_00310 [Candidatus Parcubacteria bacterium]|nr:hypothetical protein [Candidatus Parcubacteria bacterium]
MNQLAAIWQPLIVCDGTRADPCTFASLIKLTQVIINDLIVISTVLATIAFIIIGFTLLTSGGDTGAWKKARERFFSVVVGYVWILAAWLIVYTITSVLLNSGYSILGSPK